ncbi:MAG: CCA tRNA nucleotidyltransferase [Oscillospiraceae bacterium]|nr:CCA tRNA nucleotidyltransferase [Oscillospiraceae bacterium]
MNIELPNEIEEILDTLESAGYEAYVVGGCVRDSLMDKIPKDWDICTSALPEQTRVVFSGYVIIDLGLAFGTVALLPHQASIEPVEITTFRIDGVYSDNRRPDMVLFSESLEDDLSRRDFTMNAMAYNPQTGIIDLFGGIDDITNKLLKCVGDPEKRFQEDALRIMRAMRFASVLGFNIDKETSRAMQENCNLLQNIAKERIRSELNKMLLGQGISSLLIDYKYIIAEIIPEIIPMFGFEQNNPHHSFDVYTHTVLSVDHAISDLMIRLTMLLHDIGKPMCYTEADDIGHFYEHSRISTDLTKEILLRLKYDSNTIKTVSELVLYHDVEIEPRNKHIKRWLNRIGEERLFQLIEVQRADAMAQSESSRDEKLDKLNKLPDIIKGIIEQQQCFSLKDLAINGHDLLALGVSDGKEIGIVLNQLLEIVIDEKVENNKEELANVVISMYPWTCQD